MGCDIHLHVEVKLNGKWEHLNAPYIGRDYQLFGRMAGVRDDEQPHIEPRGLPQELSVITTYDVNHWAGDGHSHSWLNAKEAGEIQKWYEEKYSQRFHPPLFGYVFGNLVDSYVKNEDDEDDEEDTPKSLEDVRIVFWFDN